MVRERVVLSGRRSGRVRVWHSRGCSRVSPLLIRFMSNRLHSSSLFQPPVEPLEATLPSVPPAVDRFMPRERSAWAPQPRRHGPRIARRGPPCNRGVQFGCVTMTRTLITRVKAGPYTIRGVSLGGVYTSIQVPEMKVLLDVGMPLRDFAATDHIFLSHGHGDHAGSLAAMLGIRGLLHTKRPPRVYVPGPIAGPLQRAIAAMAELQRHALEFECVPMSPGDEVELRSDLWARAFRTHHPVPSLGYLFFDRVRKLRPELSGLSGAEIGRRRKAGDESLFEVQERHELAYATDTLIRVLNTAPEICRARVLILECTFLDDRKSLEASRAGCHIHLDELLERVDDLHNEHVVLMHFSQLYSPAEVHELLARRCPPRLRDRLVVFAPKSGAWP